MLRRKSIAIFSALTFLSFPLTSSPSVAAPKEAAPAMAGPGERIHGADISRWQHPNDKPINFEKMHGAGLRFVMIKASDSRQDADRLALKYVAADRKGAQEAGIYTGFYHYALLPDVSSSSALIKDAKVQAQKVIWRIGSLGGYNEMDLPYALDLENNCVRYRANKSCSKRASKSAVTLWAKAFMSTIKEKTGRTPIFYSYPTFLESSMSRDKELSQYPLWLAQYAIDPAIPTAQPGVKSVGCYVHSWTSSSCKSQWVVWQYTSCGIAPKYGVPGNRLDLNVFRGSQEAFLALASGTWVPEPTDLMPHDETSTMVLDYMAASSTDKNVIFSLQVLRPDSSPVVTGEVKFVSGPNAAQFKFTQSVVRLTSGYWKISLKTDLPGTWNGQLRFNDPSGTHADVVLPVTFTLLQGIAPTPSPSPTAKATPKPATSNGCKNQIKN
ncbi:Acm Lyzozyme M1 (1,4-beta-N-acetylmuramidase) [Candidatus Nanopelagicaceae bacterium]